MQLGNVARVVQRLERMSGGGSWGTDGLISARISESIWMSALTCSALHSSRPGRVKLARVLSASTQRT